MDETGMTLRLGPLTRGAVERAAAARGVSQRGWVQGAISAALAKDLGAAWFMEDVDLEKRSAVGLFVIADSLRKVIRDFSDGNGDDRVVPVPVLINTVAQDLESAYPNFDRERFLNYIDRED
jgi:hypothetical protein